MIGMIVPSAFAADITTVEVSTFPFEITLVEEGTVIITSEIDRALRLDPALETILEIKAGEPYNFSIPSVMDSSNTDGWYILDLATGEYSIIHTVDPTPVTQLTIDSFEVFEEGTQTRYSVSGAAPASTDMTFKTTKPDGTPGNYPGGAGTGNPSYSMGGLIDSTDNLVYGNWILEVCAPEYDVCVQESFTINQPASADTTPPVITVPTGMTVISAESYDSSNTLSYQDFKKSQLNSVQNWPPTAVDDVDGAITTKSDGFSLISQSNNGEPSFGCEGLNANPISPDTFFLLLGAPNSSTYQSPPTFGVGPGVYPVFCYAMDSAGNRSEATFYITVIEDTPADTDEFTIIHSIDDRGMSCMGFETYLLALHPYHYFMKVLVKVQHITFNLEVVFLTVMHVKHLQVTDLQENTTTLLMDYLIL